MNTFHNTAKNNLSFLQQIILTFIIFQLAFIPALVYCVEENIEPLAPFTNGKISTLAGTGEQGFNDGVLATKANLAFPSGLALDSKSNIFVADSINNRIRKIDANTGIITTITGNGIPGFAGDNGLAINASLDFGDEVGDVEIDTQGNIFIADSFNDRIRRVDAQTTIITTIAGNGEGDFSGDNGPAKQASLLIPSNLLLDAKEGLLISDSLNDRVRRIDLNTIFS